MIYIGFDYGDKRTGVAISDASAFLAGGLCTITMPSMTRTAEEAVRLAKKYDGDDTGSFVNGILGAYARSLNAPKTDSVEVAE